MFKYGNSNRNSQPKEKQVKQIAEVRSVTYTNYHPKRKEPIITQGFEIVREFAKDPSVVIEGSPVVVGSKTVENLKNYKPPRNNY